MCCCGVRVVSLIVDEPQTIPADGYHLLRFPFGSAESKDPWEMHQVVQPDGHTVTDWQADDRSGLIWPSSAGWGSFTGMIFWEPGDYTEVRSRFVRDPLNLPGGVGYNSTATEDMARTPGGQYRHRCHEMNVEPGVPVGLLVRHNASGPVDVTFAEFKLAIHPEALPA